MKKSLLKRFISLTTVLVLVLSIGSTSVFAARKKDELHTIRVSQTSKSNSFSYTDVTSAYRGEHVQLNVVTDDEYIVDYITISWTENFEEYEKYLYEDDRAYEISENEGVWDFVMPDGNVRILVRTTENWRDKSFSIDFNETDSSQSSNRGIVTSSKYRVKYLDDIVLTAIPNTGYTVETLKVNGKALTPSRVNSNGSIEYDYTVDAAEVSVKAKFIPLERGKTPILLKETSGGEITADKLFASHGDSVTITVKPDKGKTLDNIFVDKIHVAYNDIKVEDGVYKYTFTMPNYTPTIEATYKKSTSTSTPVITPSSPSAPKWEKVGNMWRIKDANGNYITGWHKMGNLWYYMDRAGDMLTDWQMIGKDWYFLKASGAMATSWQMIGGNWYYFKSNGAMATGWALSGGKWYYLYSDGKMASSTVIDGYKLDASGAWVK